MFGCKTFILDVPGVEYLDDLVEKIDNAESLSAKIYKMMREQAHIFYVNHFSEENYYHRLISFYKEVLA